MAEEQESLAELFGSVARRSREFASQSLARWDITPGQSRALIVLARNGSIRPSGLSTHLRIAPRSATEVIDGLEAKGLVERVPDPADRRATLLSLTDDGRQTVHRMRASRGAGSEKLFARLSASDRAELARILRLLRD